MPRLVGSLIWEQPQTALGTLLLLFQWLFGLVERVECVQDRVFVQTRGGGVSLGLFVFHNGRESRWFYPQSGTRQHEYGHTIQSRWLGPFYLVLVGTASLGRGVYAVIYRELTGRRWRGYFDGWPEDQADRLGGVDRRSIKATWPPR